MPFLIKVICYNFKNKKFWSLKYLFNNLVENIWEKKPILQKIKIIILKNYHP